MATDHKSKPENVTKSIEREKPKWHIESLGHTGTPDAISSHALFPGVWGMFKSCWCEQSLFQDPSGKHRKRRDFREHLCNKIEDNKMRKTTNHYISDIISLAWNIRN
eukprot:3368525-Amphidinium_carterae.1